MLVEINIASPFRLGKVGPAPEGKASSHFLDVMPGINNVDPEDWKAVEKHPVVQHHLKTKVLNDEHEKVLAFRVIEDGPKLDSLAKHTQKRALEIISGTLVPETLAQWLSSETRPTVARALQAQLKDLQIEEQQIDDELVKIAELEDEVQTKKSGK